MRCCYAKLFKSKQQGTKNNHTYLLHVRRTVLIVSLAKIVLWWDTGTLNAPSAVQGSIGGKISIVTTKAL
jgi:hypothetical protein